MGEKEWDLGLFRKMQQLVETHKLAYSGPDRYLDVDDEYADRAFRAAVAFLSEAGVYCISTNRVIHFDEEEVLDVVKSAPHEFVVGEGRDTRVVRKRRMEEIDGLVTERLRGVPLVDYGDRRMLAYKDFECYFAPMREMYDFPAQKSSKVLVANAMKAGTVLADLGLDLEAAATKL
jgi:hypothetical protein